MIEWTVRRSRRSTEIRKDGEREQQVYHRTKNLSRRRTCSATWNWPSCNESLI